MIDPTEPCYTILATGALCGHPYGRHFGPEGPCLSGAAGGESSVCPCVSFTRRGDDA
jgi:hypothetical protein